MGETTLPHPAPALDAWAGPLQDERFLVLGAAGRGGMARVYRAFDRLDGRIVALKVSDDAAPAGPAHPLAREYDAWSRLEHPNVAAAYALQVARGGPLPDGVPYLVLEHVDGPPVDRRSNGPLAPERVERLAIDVLRALDHVHAAGWVHRDVKPANLLLDTGADRARPKLIDFGLATPAGEAEEPGRVSGSLPYVAPEVLLGCPLDGRTDLYALGVVLYRLATGALPVPGRDLDALMRWHLAGPPADPRARLPRFPPRLARFVRRLTERDPERRPSGAAEALALLGVVPDSGDLASARRSWSGRAERAALRLAIDAVRLGARRRFRTPAEPDAAAALARRARVWAHTFGLGFHDLRDGLVRTVLELLFERGSAAGDAVRARRLDRFLPLALVGGAPVQDPARAVRVTPPGAREIAAFVLEAATRRPRVVLAPRTSVGRIDAAEAAVAAALAEALNTAPVGAALLLVD